MTFKKSKLTLLLSLVFGSGSLVSATAPAQAQAGGCSNTTVIAVLDYPAMCGGKGAFMTAASGAFWICAANEQQMRIATAAYLSGKPTYYLLTNDSDCNPGSSYNASKAPTYLYVQ